MFKKAQEGLRRLKKVEECQRRKDFKRFKIYNCFLIWLGSKSRRLWLGSFIYRLDSLLINVGASESCEGLVF